MIDKLTDLEALPFAGVRVIDLTHVIAGPFASYQLALLGADVVKVEAAGRPDPARARGPDAALAAAGRGLTYQVQGANKRAIQLDLATGEDRAVLLDLLAKADVFVHNLRGDVLAAHGFGSDVLATRLPGLVQCAISGFGDAGARRAVGAYDNVIQAASGVVAQSGGVKPGLSMVDYGAGWNAAFAIAAALHARQRDGRGRIISVSMLETALMMMGPEVAAAIRAPDAPPRREAGLGCYTTQDGALMLGVFTPAQHRTFWSALRDEGYDVGDFDRLRDWEEAWRRADALAGRIAAILATRTAAAWESWLHARKLPGERVRTLAEGIALARAERSGFFATIDGVELPVAAFAFDRGGPELRRAPPRPGEHSAEVLAELNRR